MSQSCENAGFVMNGILALVKCDGKCGCGEGGWGGKMRMVVRRVVLGGWEGVGD